MVAYLLALGTGCDFQPRTLELDTEPVVVVHELSQLDLPPVRVLDAHGEPAWPEWTVTWTVDPPLAGVVEDDGTLVPLVEGVLTVTAHAGDAAASYVVVVSLPDEVLLQGLPADALLPGAMVPVHAEVRADGVSLPGHAVTLASSDPSVASVVDGALVARSSGTTTIVASWRRVRVEVPVTVTAPLPVSDLGYAIADLAE